MRCVALILTGAFCSLLTGCMDLPKGGKVLRDYRRDYLRDTHTIARIPGFKDQYPIPQANNIAPSSVPVSLYPPRLRRFIS